MKASYFFVLITCFVLLWSCSHTNVPEVQEVGLTQYVDPFIGTDGTGHTFPGPSMPFGMVQPGPDNQDHGWDYTSGYQYRDSTIIGFSNTRASGTGINEFGDVLLMPFVDRSASEESKPEITAYKGEEKAEVGYYSVELSSDIQAELTATERVALHRYTYPSSKKRLLVDLQHGLRFFTDSLVLASDVKVSPDRRSISGYGHTRNWVERKYFFTLHFSEAAIEVKLLEPGPKENAPRYHLTFESGSEQLLCKVGLSTVSVEGAEKNLKRELPHWDFEQVRSNAKVIWEDYLNRVEITADEQQKRIFYTAMYHLFLQPSDIADVDGKYRGADDIVATASSGSYYSTLSLWDTYRAAHPLYTLIAPERVDGFIETFLAHYDAQGYLPIWTAWGQENHCMIGNHAIPVIADAAHKGFSGFNYDRALDAMITSTTESHLNSDWKVYNTYGYYPYDFLDNESVSRTLESGFDDYAVSILSHKMGRDSTATAYHERSRYYENLFDPSTGLMRGKDSKGHFRPDFKPLQATSPLNDPGDYTEANAWQYTWTPSQYDVENYIQLLGGKQGFTQQLDKFFSIQSQGDNKHLGQEGLIGQYAHGNEPSHHVAYLYAFSEKPEKGRELVSRIYNNFYSDKPDGITGNEDCGQMSAWYIFTTLGLYPVNPANATYVLGVPQVEEARVQLDDGKFLTITTETGDQECTVMLDDISLTTPVFKHAQLQSGGSLKFTSCSE